MVNHVQCHACHEFKAPQTQNVVASYDARSGEVLEIDGRSGDIRPRMQRAVDTSWLTWAHAVSWSERSRRRCKDSPATTALRSAVTL